jgi:SPP1 gp7 family putative phage head morphogenesis protein
MSWNKKQINSSVLQGVLQGESIDKMAKRLLPIVGNNEKAAIRTARTMVTGAENRGRQDRYDEYEEAGVVMNKVWIATPDNRVRDWHLSLDGQEVPTDGYFVDGLGQELEYPGDPYAPPNTVYNCRCSMRSHILGMRQSDGSFRGIGAFKSPESLHDKQISEERERRNGR